MRLKLLVLVAVVSLLVVQTPRFVPGQTSSGNSGTGFPLLDRLDEFGKSIFGGAPSTGEGKKAKSQSARASAQRSRSEPEADAPRPSRAGSPWGTEMGTAVPQRAVARAPQRPSGQGDPAVGSAAQAFVRDETTEQPRASGEETFTAAPTTTDPAAAPLHERLSGFRQSLFDAPAQQGLVAEAQKPPVASAAKPGPTADSVTSPATPPRNAAPRPSRESGVLERTPAPTTMGSPHPGSSGRPAAQVPAAAPPASGSATGGRSPTASSPGIYGQGSGGGSPTGIGPARTTGPYSSPGSAGIAAQQPGDVGRAAKPAESQGVLIARQSLIVGVETIGPRRIAVGKESTYEVVVRNTGDIAAEELVVTVELPDWADVKAAEASVGATSTAKAGEKPGPFRWRVGRLEAKGRERLLLRIVPRQSRPFDLIVKWESTPISSQAQIEVQEPKLAVALLGPREVLYGKAEVYKLEVSNTGNGDAENVAISLSPSAPSDKPARATHQFGMVAAGQKKAIDVELTARQTGNLTIHVEAHGDGGLRAQLVEQIVVRRAALKVDVDAPKVQFVGTEATYRIRVSNPGNAPAMKPSVTATLPPSAKYVASPQSPRVSADGGKVTWAPDTVPPGGETILNLTCQITAPGASRLDVQCTAEGDLTASASASTQAEATANLALAVDDPSGPVPVEGDATYQVRVQNRGTASAEAVEVFAYFSNGFEPVSAEGGRHKIGPGQVVFEPIPALAAGQSAVLKVKAKAGTPGNHVYRIEVRSEPAGARVVREGTTRFYGDGPAARTPAVTKSTSPVSPPGDGIRTADRRETAPSLRQPGASSSPQQ